MKEFISEICKRYGIKNERVFDDDFLSIPGKYLPGPKAYKEWCCLLLAWKRPVSLDSLGHSSVQSAKIFQNLRDKGFIMPKTKSNYTVYNGKFRRIDGWKIPITDLLNSYVKLNSSDKKKYIYGKRDPYTMSRKNLQIDHRTPCEVSKKKFNEEPAILTLELIASGKDKDLFQVISNSTNARKREVCRKCLAGGVIPLPDSVEKGIYKLKFDDFCFLTGSCRGCYWYDFSITQEDVIKKYGNIINEINSKQLIELAEHSNSRL